MENMTKLSKRKGVSPVIATVILVAVTITVAVAVAYWMSGIAGQYTQFEKVEIQSGYAVSVDATAEIVAGTMGDWDDDPITPDTAHPGAPATPGGWTITLDLKNSGTSTSTLLGVFINDKPIDQIDIVCLQIDQANEVKLPIESGLSVTVTITINDVPTVTYSSGTTLNIKLHSAAGMDYIRLVQLS